MVVFYGYLRYRVSVHSPLRQSIVLLLKGTIGRHNPDDKCAHWGSVVISSITPIKEK